MRVTGTAVAALLFGAAEALHQFAPRSLNDTTGPSDPAPKRYIVEYKSRAHGSRVAAKVAAGFPGLRVVKQFDSDIFPAVTVECDGGCSPESVKSALDDGDEPVVATVYKSQVMQILPTVEGESYSDDAAALNYSVHGLTGVEKLHENGVLGEGAIVAIVDSGVQYTHPAVST